MPAQRQNAESLYRKRTRPVFYPCFSSFHRASLMVRVRCFF